MTKPTNPTKFEYIMPKRRKAVFKLNLSNSQLELVRKHRTIEVKDEYGKISYKAYYVRKKDQTIFARELIKADRE